MEVCDLGMDSIGPGASDRNAVYGAQVQEHNLPFDRGETRSIHELTSGVSLDAAGLAFFHGTALCFKVFSCLRYAYESGCKKNHAVWKFATLGWIL